jgi:DNA-binding MarR family transcriptional regulator
MIVASSERIAAAARLTSARWQILGAIEDAPATVAHAARGLGVTRQAVQQTADAMVREGLVTFADNPDHKRARLMSPTPAGRRALDLLRPRQVQFANLMGSAHSLEALGTTLDVLRRARTTIEAHGSDT